MNDDRLRAALETIISYQKLEADLRAENRQLKTLREERPNMQKALHMAEARAERLSKENADLAARVGEANPLVASLAVLVRIKYGNLDEDVNVVMRHANDFLGLPTPSAADRLRDEVWREAEAALTSMKIDTKTCGRDADKAVKWNCKWDSAAEILRAARPSAFEVKP